MLPNHSIVSSFRFQNMDLNCKNQTKKYSKPPKSKKIYEIDHTKFVIINYTVSIYSAVLCCIYPPRPDIVLYYDRVVWRRDDRHSHPHSNHFPSIHCFRAMLSKGHRKLIVWKPGRPTN